MSLHKHRISGAKVLFFSTKQQLLNLLAQLMACASLFPSLPSPPSGCSSSIYQSGNIVLTVCKPRSVHRLSENVQAPSL